MLPKWSNRSTLAWTRRLLSQLRVNSSHGVSITIDALSAVKCNISVESSWQEHCDVEYSHHAMSDSVVLSSHEGSNTIALLVNKSIENASFVLRVPERCDINVLANNLNLTTKNKLQGDFRVTCSSGDLRLDKVRGEIVSIEAGSSNVSVLKSLEGSIVVNAGEINAKLIHGSNVSLVANTNIQIGALYASNCGVNSAGPVSIGQMKGCLHLECSTGDVDVKGIDGSFHAFSRTGSMTLQINSVRGSSAASACHDLAVSIDPEVVASLILDSRQDSVVVAESESFTKTPVNPLRGREIVCGTLNGQSKYRSRPSFRPGRNSSGKINQAVASSPSLSDAGSPHLALLSSDGSIRLETLSWIDAIRRKHLGHDDGVQSHGDSSRSAMSQERIRELMNDLEKTNST